MANNYIPGFTPSLHGQPVKRMALGGRMESGRWFNEGRDRDTGDRPYTAEVASAAPAVAQSIASIPVAALTAAAPTVAAYQQPTPEPAQANYGFDPYDLSGFDMYGLGEYASQFYQQPTQTAPAQTSYQQQPTAQPVQTAPYVDYATPTSYQRQPTPQPVQTAAYDTPTVSNFVGGIPGTMSSDFSGVLNKVLAQAEQQGLTQPASAPTSYQRQPTPQPVQTAAYDSGYQSLPTAQPVQTAAYTDVPPIDLGGWSLANFQNQFVPTGSIPPASTSPTDWAAWQANAAQQQDPLAQYIAEQAAKGIEVVSLNPYQGSGLDAINYNIWNSYNQFDPNNPGATTGIVYRLDTGHDIGVPDGNGGWTYRNAGQVTWSPGTEYTMYDATGGKQGAVIATARTPEEMAKLVELSDKVPYYSLAKTADPNESINYGGMMPGKQDTRPGGVMGAFVNYGLPVALSFVPGLNWVGSAALAGAGSTAGKLMTGNSIEDALKSGLITAGTAGLLKAPILNNGGSLGGAIGGALEKVPGVGDALKGASGLVKGGTSYIDPTGGIVTEATKSVAPQLISGALTSGLQGALNTAAKYPGTVKYGDQVWGEQPTVQEPGASTFNPDEGISVFANKYKMPFDPNSTLNAFLGSQFGNLVNPDYSGLSDLTNQYEIEEPQEDIPEGSDEGWTVEAPKENVIIPPSAAIPELFPPINSVDIPTDLVDEWPEVPAEDNEIVVEGQRPGGGALPVVLPPVPITSVPIPPNAGLELPPTDPKKPGPSVTDILDLIKAIGIGAGAATAGGKGGSGLSAYRGALNPIFSAKLPAPSLRPAAPRALDFDAYRYGYGPEQSFFTNVPQGALNTSTAYTGYGTSPRYTASEQYAADFAALLEAIKKEEEARAASAVSSGFAQGGYAVGGPGDGREDKIPAMLSDGEYVIDAETVAMLGNGSSKAGADALDKFRVNIRKHKGRKLSKGEFSVDAKKPEQYLKGHK